VRRLALLIATALGLGYLPVVPATWASLAVAIAFLPFRPQLTPLVCLLLAVCLTPIAIAASHEAEKTLGHDARPIVIDEVAGMLVGAIGLRHPPGAAGALEILLLFVLFRIFDIAKPWPVRQSQRLPGGYGVVVDDLLAGLYTAGALWLLAGILFRG
jgi:phosphatidylglycerophosphatase A